MPQAFPEIHEPPPGTEPPLDAMAACNRRLLHHCAALRRLALYVGECGFDAEAGAATARLLHFFDAVVPAQQAAQEQVLFPALIESMAGSDAVCLHEITDGLALQHRELRRLWLGLRPAVVDLAAGRAAALPVHAIEAFIDHCKAGVATEDGELLPMAARLLSDADLERLAAAMGASGRRPT
ncbi:hemerythrin domain-containing protein [Caenimonas terrae]|uniref:Hemerythrin domain-containing protein n=1 Tax=Caenimonas terrae TaxID=696074 RepID=A0ABW0NAW4_9BURK